MQKRVVGIGELLWDVFPSGKRLGGAPVNFACHCARLGADGYPVSRVGTDVLGREIRDELTGLGIDQVGISDDPEHPTGTVQVTLDENAKPTYEICEGVAWDMIPMTAELEALARRADAICFGSLGQRHAVARKTIHQVLEAAPPHALKIFDVNLRQSFYSKDVLEASLRHSNVLKLSDEELPVMSELFQLSGNVEDQLGQLLDRFALKVVAYTRGAEGSLLLTRDESSDHPGVPVKATDSVGAGDSFTATLCVGLLAARPLAAINDHANRVASFVCSHTGAIPTLPPELRKG